MALESDTPWGEAVVWIIIGRKYKLYECVLTLVGGGTLFDTCTSVPRVILHDFLGGSSHVSLNLPETKTLKHRNHVSSQLRHIPRERVKEISPVQAEHV